MNQTKQAAQISVTVREVVGDIVQQVYGTGLMLGTDPARLKMAVRQFGDNASTPAIETVLQRLRDAITAHDRTATFDDAVSAALAGLTFQISRTGLAVPK